MKKVIVLGGGFAGVEAAIRLQKSGFCDVTLVSDRDFLYLYPISIWIPTHGISPDSVKVSLYEIQKKHGFSLIIDSVKIFRQKKIQYYAANRYLHMTM